MSTNNCKNCGRNRDINNNYLPYMNGTGAYTTSTNNSPSNKNNSITSANSNNNNNNNTKYLNNNNYNNNNNSNSYPNKNLIASPIKSTAQSAATQVTAKVMWGSVGAIKELREKEQAERNGSARAGRK